MSKHYEYHMRREDDGNYEVSTFFDGVFQGNSNHECEQSAVLTCMDYARRGYTERKSRIPDRLPR